MIDVNAIKRIDPEIVLSKLGLSYKKVGGNIFTSIRDEKTPSVSIHNKNGQWLYKDFGDGSGGSWIDLTMKVLNVDYKSAIQILSSDYSISAPSFSRPAFEKKDIATKRKNSMTINAVKDQIDDKRLIEYLKSRNITIIPSWLKQINYTVTKNDKEYINNALAIKNSKDGYALRSEKFKGNIGASGYSFFKGANPDKNLIIVEGMFDALSVNQINRNVDILCLNSVENLNDKVVQAIKNKNYKKVLIGLDNDEAGKKAVLKLKSLDNTFEIKLKDCKDINDCLVKSPFELKNYLNLNLNNVKPRPNVNQQVAVALAK